MARAVTRQRRYVPRVAWSPEEDSLIDRFARDYETLALLLPSRTYGAIRKRIARLSLQRTKQPWKTSEDRKLRAMRSSGASIDAIAAALPGRTPRSVRNRCIRYGVRSPRPPPRPHQGALGAIELEAYRRGLSLRDLDQLANTGRYYRRSRGRVVLEHLAAGAAALGGWIDIEWEPLN